LLYPESRAAIAAAGRAGRLSRGRTPNARRELEALWRDVDCVEVTPEIAFQAGELAEAHRLRGYDAVHLASLLEVANDETVLVSADAAMAAVARALGLMPAELPA
jgi:predicted nucleic acid-binding protein